MANQSDPSWMQAADAMHRPAPSPGGLVPAVYGPGGGGVQPPTDQTDTAGAPGTGASPEGAPAPAPAAQAQESPRRQAFLAAMRSKPLQGASAGAEVSEAREEAALPAPPTLAEMNAAADAEAERRSVPTAAQPADGERTPAVQRQGFGEFVTATPLRTSGSSYVTRGAGGVPQQSPAEDMTLRRSGHSAGRAVVPVGR